VAGESESGVSVFRPIKAAAPPPKPIAEETDEAVDRRLRKAMAEVATLAQFEVMLSKAHPDHVEQMRAKLTPMLRPNLPCCRRAWNEPHEERCPAKPVPQGRCETTLTERFSNPECRCPTYAGNLGPCAQHEVGGNGRCVYCDHELTCHPASVDEAATIGAAEGE
jgi:hypothetical protein